MAPSLSKAALDAAIAGIALEPEEHDAITRLEDQDLALIDRAILSSLDRNWKSAGFIAAGVMIAAPDEHEDVPELVYALRIRALAEASQIEARGDLNALKASEIRLPATQEAV